jgi:hypothetical protein
MTCKYIYEVIGGHIQMKLSKGKKQLTELQREIVNKIKLLDRY